MTSSTLGPERGTAGTPVHAGNSPRRGRALWARVSLVALAALSCAVLIPASAFATNAQGGHYVSASDCPQGLCNFRMTQATLQRSGTAWTVPSSTAGYEWIGVSRTSGNGCDTNGFAGGCIVQTGYGKFDSGGASALGCPTDTGGDVKVIDYWIDGSGNRTCTVGNIISSGGTHTLKVSRCGSGDWCVYNDGTQERDWSNTGIGVTAPLASAIAEFTCFGCMNSGTSISTNFGTSGSGSDWLIGDNVGTTIHVKQADVNRVHVEGCSSASDWQIDDVSTTSSWTLAWLNHGVAC